MRHLTLLCVFIMFITGLRGQPSGDSVLRTYHLNEVCVCDKSGENTQTFNFYRSNKLSGIEDILGRMQGVNMIRRGAYGLEPTLRSFGTGQTNLTLDGMRMYGACTDKMDPVSIYIEPMNLSAIQVTHGPAGATEGSTIGGHIGLKLNEPRFQCHSTVSGQFSQSFLSVNNGSNSSAIIQQSFKKLAYRVSGTFRTAGDYRAGGDARVPYSGFQKLNTSVSAIYQLRPGRQLKADYIGDLGSNIGYPALPMDVGKAVAHIAALTHRSVFKQGAFLKDNEIKVYMNRIMHYMDDTHRKDALMHMDMPGTSRTIGFYNQINARGNLKVRLDYHQAVTFADMTMYPEGEPEMYMQTLPENMFGDLGLSVSRWFSLPKKQQISVQGRMDYVTHSVTEGIGADQWDNFQADVTRSLKQWLKNANVAYLIKPLSNTEIRFQTGYGERTPTANERYGYYLFNRQDQYDYIGNHRLRPERSIQAECVWNQKYRKTEFSVNIFYSRISDYIYAYRLSGLRMTPGALGLKSYENIDYAHSKGLEGSLKSELKKDLYYLGSFKYLNASAHDGTPLPLIAPFKIQEALRYQYKSLQFQIEHDYAAQQSRVNSDYGDRVTPSFHLFHLRASHKMNIRNAKLQILLACENVLDRTYHEHLDIGNIPRFGRNFTVNLNYLF